MPLINFSGIASGIDSNALIKATSDVARATRVLPSQNKIEEYKATNTALGSLKTKLQKLQDVLFGFSTAKGGPLQKSASSSDETKVSATASTAALNGTYSLTVTTLAKAGSFSFANDNPTTITDPPTNSIGEYTSSSAVINPNIITPSNVTVAIGTGTDQTSFTIQVSATTTLSAFVTEFNTKTTKAVATIVNVGTSVLPDYRVVVNGTNEGTAKGSIAITIPDEIKDPDGNPLHRAWNSNTIVPATDATFSVSGIGGTITRSTNSVSDIIPGVTFTLKDDGGAEANIVVRDDTAGTTSKIQEFISAYNDVVAFVQENNKVERDDTGQNAKNIFSPLALTSIDNNAITSVRASFTGAAYFNTGDSTTATNEIRILADLGIATDSGAYNAETKTGGGTLKFTASSTDANTSNLQNALSKEPSSVNEILKKLGDLAASAGAGLNGGAGSIVQFTRFNGLLDTSVTSNKTQIDDLNDRIARAEEFILKQEESMRARFARLESLIGGLQNKQSALSSALSSLPRLG